MCVCVCVCVCVYAANLTGPEAGPLPTSATTPPERLLAVERLPAYRAGTRNHSDCLCNPERRGGDPAGPHGAWCFEPDPRWWTPTAYAQWANMDRESAINGGELRPAHGAAGHQDPSLVLTRRFQLFFSIVLFVIVSSPIWRGGRPRL